MVGTEVVYRTHQVHGIVQGFRLPRQRTTPTDQGCHARAEGGIQALDVGGVDLPPSLCLLQQGVDVGRAALNHTAFHGHNPFPSVLLDDLSNMGQPWANRVTTMTTVSLAVRNR